MNDFDIFTKIALPYNVGDLGKKIAATGFAKLPKVQKNAQSGHTACELYRERDQECHTLTGAIRN